MKPVLRKIFLAFSVFVLMCFICRAQPVASPDVKCVSVAANGDVTLTWATPAGPGGFIDYKIFSAPALAGPYTNVGTVLVFSQTTFTDFGAGANTQRVYYLVQTEYNPGNIMSAPADTFSTIHLLLTNLTNQAKLDWNAIASPNVSTSSNVYKIYREYPTGVWTLRGGTGNLTYTDIIDVCDDTLTYRIEIADNTGCTSVSNTAGGWFMDQTPPVIAALDTVTVNGAGLAVISWNPSPSPDCDSVIIYNGTSTAGPWVPITAVSVPLNSYTYPLSNAANVSEIFAIAFKDSCGNLSPIGIPHKTIYLSAQFDICAATASLKWNRYINWSPAANNYEILKSVNLSPFTLIASQTSSDTDYVDNNISLGDSYCYLVRASNTLGQTSTSNKACFIANVTQPPNYNYNRYASVITDKQIDIKAYVDPSASSVKYYNLMRAVNGSGAFTLVNTFAPPTGTILQYLDNSVNASVNSYVYKWDAMDSCGHLIMTSNYDTTMLLTANAAANLDIILSWNDYGSFDGGVAKYEIYRAVDGVWNPSPIGTAAFTGNGGTYTDDAAQFFSSSGIFSYRVEALENGINSYGFSDSSSSNTAKLYEYPKFYLPNAFTPNNDGINDIFIPVIGFIDASNYTFTIFDNTGTPVMKTTNPAEGWDGKKKGHPCQEGVYMYLIQCRASNGDDSKIAGTVSLIR